MSADDTLVRRRRLRRPEIDMRRVVVALPSGFTLGNLFFGIFAIISAARGEVDRAVLFIVLGGVCDAFDGRVARATKSGTRFGEELDSLVDAISFGLAPAMITYFAVLQHEGRWTWMLVFIFCAFAVMRLARFNVTQAGAAKSYFVGLPSPAAGGTLATYHWFRGTDLYNQTVIGDMPWGEWVKFLMIALSILMMSNVRYPAVPRIGFRSLKQIVGTLVIIGTLWGVIFHAKEFLFPFGVGYVLYGLVGTVFAGLLDMRPNSAAARERALREAYDRPEYALATEELMADDVDEDVEFEARRAARAAALRDGPASERETRDREARRAARKDRDRGERSERPPRERGDRPARERPPRAEKPERGERPVRDAGVPAAATTVPATAATAAPAAPSAPLTEAEEQAARDRRAERRERQKERQRERLATRASAEGAPPLGIAASDAIDDASPASAPRPLAMDAEDLADGADGDGDGTDAGTDGAATAEGTERKRRKRRRKRRGTAPDALASALTDEPGGGAPSAVADPVVPAAEHPPERSFDRSPARPADPAAGRPVEHLVQDVAERDGPYREPQRRDEPAPPPPVVTPAPASQEPNE